MSGRPHRRSIAGSLALLVLVGAVLVPALAWAAGALPSQARIFVMPFLACLVMAATHSYLGLHVIRREIIFVDLGFAQLAALGSIVALVPVVAGAGVARAILPVAFVVLGALVFTLSRTGRREIPQEAVIGIVYVVVTAAGFVVADRIAQGLERVKEAMVGKLLWVGAADIVLLAWVSTAAMAVHMVFHERFERLSQTQGGAVARVSRRWDFLFYLTFGLVIMRSVDLGGILLVFVLLVAPAGLAVQFREGLWHQIVLGWGFSAAAAACGIALSFSFDLPAGPAVVCLLAGGPALAFAARRIRIAERPFRTAMRGGAVAGTAIATLYLIALAAPEARHEHAHSADHDSIHTEPDGRHSNGSLAEHLVDHLAETCDADRGLASPVCPHFGSAPFFMIVDPDAGTHQAIPNGNRVHGHGMCQPLAALAGQDVQCIVVGGIGQGALFKLRQANIDVFLSRHTTVQETLSAWKAGSLQAVDPANSCGHHGPGPHGPGQGPGQGCAHGSPQRRGGN